ncbi:MAG: translation initiation factor IF-3 [Candidatus Poribacteria bacterium]
MRFPHRQFLERLATFLKPRFSIRCSSFLFKGQERDRYSSEVYKISRVNRQIRAREILVIDEEGTKIGVMSPYEGMKLAQEKQLDLVEVAPNARPPVCRIMDYGKYMYEQSKRAKSARKHQKVIKIKEVKFKPDTAEHDYQFKFRHAKKFLESGDKVKATVIFKGREIVHSHLGRQMLERLAKDLSEISNVEQMAKMATNRSMTMILAPKESE